MGRKIINLVTALLILAGAGLLLYPTVSNYWNSLRQTSAIADYTKAVEQLDSVDEEAILEEARAYNQSLMEDKNRWTLTDEEYETYSNTLDPFGTGMMGYLTIPKIQVSLPIYHGTSQSVLQAGAGHLPGSSLPVGGVGTHTVLSGHRGLPSSRLFTDLDELEEGDYFELQVLTEKLTYEVEEIQVVEPQDLQGLAIEEDRDLCSLVTCTPYGINSHRLVVTGHRIPNKEETQNGEQETIKTHLFRKPWLILAAVLAVLLAAGGIVWGVFGKRRKNKN